MYGPDGSAGVTFVLVQATLTDNYHQGQLYSAGKGKADGGGCASTTTGRVGETITLSVLGGTGKFANASGSIKLTFIGQVLAGGLASAAIARFGSIAPDARAPTRRLLTSRSNNAVAVNGECPLKSP